jgi:hypothetical protein
MTRHAPPPGRGRARPVHAPPLEGPFGQGPMAVLAPLALADPHQQALGVDVRDLARGAFSETPATGIDHPPTHRGVRACDRGPQDAHCWRTPHAGECLAVPRPRAGDERPRARQGPRRAEPEALEGDAEGPLGDLLVLAQRQKVLAEGLVAALVRRASGVWRQVAHSGDITRWGLRGTPPTLQGFQQAASPCRHGHSPVRVAHDPSPTGDTHRTIDGRSA